MYKRTQQSTEPEFRKRSKVELKIIFLKYRYHFLLFFPLAILAQEKKVDYAYVKLSDQWGVFPGLGIGYRCHDLHGFDVDFTAYTYWDGGYCLYGKTHYLFYPRREYFYLGIGAGCIGGKFKTIWDSGSGSFIKPTLEGVIGCEWKLRDCSPFLQLEIGGTYGKVPVYPVLSFGIGF